MRIATFNVNGITSRLPALLEWLEETRPDVACLQELKAPQEKFPEDALKAVKLPRHLARPEKLERRGDPRARNGAHRGRARTAWRRERCAKPLPRGRRRRRADLLSVSAERQPRPRPQVRLQARLVRAPDRARRHPDRQRRTGGAGLTTSM
ncbi:endonuclease/exonuclease/phosphatase family protein [Massilia sp. B-10]|nr:endonuclease/exonuclease/phosphatase family protein [Massilia sp. B-10]